MFDDLHGASYQNQVRKTIDFYMWCRFLFLWDTKILESRIRCDIIEGLLPFGVQLRCRVARTKGMFSLYFLYNFLLFFLLLKEYFTRRSTNGKDVETQFIF